MKKKQVLKSLANNSITFEMDRFVDKEDIMGFPFEMERTIQKSYSFQKWDSDILNAPKSHKIEVCHCSFELTSKQEIKDAIKFLQNLEPSIIK